MSDRPPRDSGNRPDESRPRDESGSGDAEPTFGSFVSDSVRRSAGRFRQDPGETAPSRRRRRDGQEDTSVSRQRAGRPGTRQRRERSFAPSEPVAEEPADGTPISVARPAWMQEAIDRAGGPERALAALAILIVALLALVWLLASLLGGDDGGDDPTPTEALQVLPIGDSGTPPGDTGPVSTPRLGPGSDIVTPTPSPSDAAPSTVRGSDNVLDQAPGTPAADAGEPSASCGEACLARVERTPEAEQVLASSGTRPSYSGDEWFWVIAEPEEIASISSELRTEVVRESTDTVRLYMVVLPSDATSDAPASQLGNVIDEVDSYRLVEAETAPANVRQVLDAGLTVEKVAPAPSESSLRPDSPPGLTESDIGSLSGNVDPARLEQSMVDLQASGSNDGTGIGTRYYSSPGNQVAAEYLFRKLESYGLDVWYEDFVTWDGLLLVNVVGEIVGRDSSRIYGVMAHLDSISETPRAVAPGADDNASGVAGTLEIARVLAGYDLQYSFRAIFVNYEETGVVGSEEFAREAVTAGEPWQGIFNLDSIGSPRHAEWIVLNAEGSSVWMQELITRVNDAYGLDNQFTIQQSDEIVADDTRLREQGLESVLVARELYGASPVHHTNKDVMENVSIPHTESVTQLILLSVASLLI